MKNRPKVVVIQAASADGRLTLSPDTLLLFGDERWNAVAGEGSELWSRLKAQLEPGAILEGSGSLVLDGTTPDPLPPVTEDTAGLWEDFLPDEIVNRPGHRGWFTVVDSRGRVRWLYKEFPGEEWAGWYLMVLVARQTPAEYLAYLRREKIPYLVAGDARVDLRAALGKLADRLGITCVLSEAGGRLNGALLRAGLIDEVNLDIFPALIGGTATPSLFDSPELLPGELPTRLSLISAEARDDGHVWLRYAIAAGDPSRD